MRLTYVVYVCKHKVTMQPNKTLLRKVLNAAKKLVVEDYEDPHFEAWKTSAEITIEQIFGSDSRELREFRKLKFYHVSSAWGSKEDYMNDNLSAFKNDMIKANELIRLYISSMKVVNQDPKMEYEMEKINKVFVSHSSKDIDIVEDILEVLELIGLKNDQIFCSSFPGYGISLGENFLDRLKKELDEKVFVIFVLSKNFYSSPVCLCEMGATWVKTNEHVPILIPPLRYEEVTGVIPLTQGFKINESLKLNLLKDKIEKMFSLSPIDPTIWERRRDRILTNITKKLIV